MKFPFYVRCLPGYPRITITSNKIYKVVRDKGELWQIEHNDRGSKQSYMKSKFEIIEESSYDLALQISIIRKEVKKK